MLWPILNQHMNLCMDHLTTIALHGHLKKPKVPSLTHQKFDLHGDHMPSMLGMLDLHQIVINVLNNFFLKQVHIAFWDRQNCTQLMWNYQQNHPRMRLNVLQLNISMKHGCNSKRRLFQHATSEHCNNWVNSSKIMISNHQGWRKGHHREW